MMLKALIKSPNKRLSTYPRLVEDLSWLLQEADKLEDKRNDAIHSPLVFLDFDGDPTLKGYVIPFDAFGNPRALKLAQKDLLAEFRWCRDASIVLRHFATDLYDAVAARDAWPDRPSLPNRGQKRTRQGQRPPAPTE